MSAIGINGDKVGVSVGDMETVCSNLRQHADNINTLVNELRVLTGQLPEIWEGEDLDDFVTEFKYFESQLAQMPSIVAGIADWGEKKKLDYEESASRVIKSTRNIFGA